jgi:transcriptional regulator with XRE-family HTH domain
MPTPLTIGARVVKMPGLYRTRLTKAWTQEELAERAGIGRMTVVRLEAGDDGRVTTLRKLAEALECPPDELRRE